MSSSSPRAPTAAAAEPPQLSQRARQRQPGGGPLPQRWPPPRTRPGAPRPARWTPRAARTQRWSARRVRRRAGRRLQTLSQEGGVLERAAGPADVRPMHGAAAVIQVPALLGSTAPGPLTGEGFARGGGAAGSRHQAVQLLQCIHGGARAPAALQHAEQQRARARRVAGANAGDDGANGGGRVGGLRQQGRCEAGQAAQVSACAVRGGTSACCITTRPAALLPARRPAGAAVGSARGAARATPPPPRPLSTARGWPRAAGQRPWVGRCPCQTAGMPCLVQGHLEASSRRPATCNGCRSPKPASPRASRTSSRP